MKLKYKAQDVNTQCAGSGDGFHSLEDRLPELHNHPSINKPADAVSS